jgi:hypothetical protein
VFTEESSAVSGEKENKESEAHHGLAVTKRRVSPRVGDEHVAQGLLARFALKIGMLGKASVDILFE